MELVELLKSKKYFTFRKKSIKRRIPNELNNELIDFLIYESHSISEEYINDKEFMSFLDGIIYNYILERNYIGDKLYTSIINDREINYGSDGSYESHSDLNDIVEYLLDNDIFPRSCSLLITKNLDKIINYDLMRLLIDYDECLINSKVSNIIGFYDKYLDVIDRYIIRLCGDNYDNYRKKSTLSRMYHCDNSFFYSYELVDYIVRFFPSEELLKERTLKVLSKYRPSLLKVLFDKISVDEKKIIYLLEGYIYNGISIDEWFVNCLFEIPISVVEYIFNNYLELICINSKDIFLFIENVERIYGKEYSDQIKDCVKGNKDYIFNSMIYPVLSKRDSKDFKNAKELVKLIVEDIMKNEGINSYTDITRIGFGFSSNVYRIGNKVLKIGNAKSRLSLIYPNNPFIIKPLIRKVINLKEKDLLVEVQEYVPTYIPTKKEKEDIYIKLRELGIIWIDPNDSNFSRLEKDNIIYWNGNLEPSDEALGLLPGVGNNILLHKGDICINDADAFYTGYNEIYDINTPISINPDVYCFEAKYKKRKK